MLRKDKFLTILGIIGLLLPTPNSFATVQVKAIQGQPVSVCTPSDSNTNCGGGSSTVPGGSGTNIQYNNTGLFGGISNSSVDATNGFIGLNESSPNASVHAGIKTVTAPSISNLTLTINFAPSSGGYAFGSGSKVYYVYSKDSINGTVFYDSGVDAEFDEPATSIYDPSSLTANINYGESGYTSSGLTLQYQVWALYPNSQESLGVVQSTPTSDDNSGNPFGVDISYSQPTNGAPSNGYLIEQIQGPNSGQYVTSSSTSFVDNNSGWGAIPGGLTNITYGVNGSWTAASGAVDYIAINTANTTYTDTSGSNSFSDLQGWTSGSPSTVPNSYSYESLISEGTTEIAKTTGGIGFFNVPPETQQSGDVAVAMAEYGLVTSPYYDMTRAEYSNSNPLSSGSTLLDYSGNYISDGFGDVHATSSLVGPNSSGFDSNGYGLVNKLILNVSALVGAVDGTLEYTGSSGNLWFTEGTNRQLVGLIPITAQQGGTGLTSIAQGAIPFASALNAYSTLAKNTTATRYIANTGTSNNPAWNQILGNGVNWTNIKAFASTFGGDHSGINWQSFGT